MPIKHYIYKCQYCGATAPYRTQGGKDAYRWVKEHEEKRCWKNPTHRTCLTCTHFINRECTIESGYSEKIQIKHRTKTRKQLYAVPFNCPDWYQRKRKARRNI